MNSSYKLGASAVAALRGLDPVAAISFLDAIFGNPNPEDDKPVGPWGPILRGLGSTVFGGPPPVPWRGYGSFVHPADLVGLNPQPLPPAWMLMADALVGRAELMAEAARAAGSDRGATGYVTALVDDLCPPPRIIIIPPIIWWPWPKPPRPDEIELSDVDIILFGTRLRQHSVGVFDRALGEEIAASGEKAIEAGLVGLQG